MPHRDSRGDDTVTSASDDATDDQLRYAERGELDNRADCEDGCSDNDASLATKTLTNEHGHQGAKPASNIVDGNDEALQVGIAVARRSVDARKTFGECSSGDDAAHNTLLCVVLVTRVLSRD